MNAARVLREARARAGLSQRELSAKAKVPQAAIARIERGRTIPRVDTLDKLLEACGEGLYVDARKGIGVDKTLAEGLLATSPAERTGTMYSYARGQFQMMRDVHAKIGGVVREGKTFTREPSEPPTSWGEIFRILASHSVRFVVIGGVAGNAHGSPSITLDLDICYSHDRENVRALAMCLHELSATLRGAPKDLPNVIDERFLWDGLNFTFDTKFGRLDCLASPAGVEGHDELARSASTFDLFGTAVLVCSLSDLIRMKRAAGRIKDRVHLEELGALQEVIDEEERRRRDK